MYMLFVLVFVCLSVYTHYFTTVVAFSNPMSSPGLFKYFICGRVCQLNVLARFFQYSNISSVVAMPIVRVIILNLISYWFESYNETSVCLYTFKIQQFVWFDDPDQLSIQLELLHVLVRLSLTRVRTLRPQNCATFCMENI